MIHPAPDLFLASARRAVAIAHVGLAAAGCGAAGRRSAILVALSVLLVGCGTSPGPSASSVAGTPSPPPIGSADAGPSEPVDFLTQQLAGPWRRSPIILDEGHIAIISDACATAARAELGEVEANLPTAVVDARGEHLATAILADDLDAIECLVHLDDAGTAATVDSVDRLSVTTLAPATGSAISVASVVHADDRPGGRTIAFGRLGPDAEAAKVGFDDASVILATDAEGWWAMWWQGTVRASGYSAVDSHDIVIGSQKPFNGEREARVRPASWWVDPAAKPGAGSTTIKAFLQERACAGGKTPEGRIEPPRIDVTSDAITVSYQVRLLPGPQDCAGNLPFRVSLALPEALGNRKLLDGSSDPPRDATTVP
jgi:hypothetical protein